ncbi:vacuolar membrane-associated protein iml1 [Cladochytrium tenue]|nr:vacuolar membrane-associated protein iml1 [Cladochytrium tenue]
MSSYTLWLHDEAFSPLDLVVHPDHFQFLAPGDLVEILPVNPVQSVSASSGPGPSAAVAAAAVPGAPSLQRSHELPRRIRAHHHGQLALPYSGEDLVDLDDTRLILHLKKFDHDIAARLANLQISIARSVAEIFGLQSRSMVYVRKIDKALATAEYVTLAFRDQYLSRSDMWWMRRELEGNCVHVGRKLTTFRGRVQVKEVVVAGKQFASAQISEGTKLIYRTESARMFLFIQLSKEMWEFAPDGDLYYEKVQSSGGKPNEDFYRVVIEWESRADWSTVLVPLKVELLRFGNSLIQPNRTSSGSNSPASEGNILEAINLALNPFDKHYIDRDLMRTGLSIIVVTPSPGIFKVDKTLARLTTQRIIENGIGCDIVSLARPPLYTVPLFQFKARAPSTVSAASFGSTVGLTHLSGASSDDGAAPYESNNVSRRTGPPTPVHQTANDLDRWDPFNDDDDPEGPFATYYTVPQWVEVSFYDRDAGFNFVDGFRARCAVGDLYHTGYFLPSGVPPTIYVDSLDMPRIPTIMPPNASASYRGSRNALDGYDDGIFSPIHKVSGNVNGPSSAGVDSNGLGRLHGAAAFSFTNTTVPMRNGASSLTWSADSQAAEETHSRSQGPGSGRYLEIAYGSAGATHDVGITGRTMGGSLGDKRFEAMSGGDRAQPLYVTGGVGQTGGRLYPIPQSLSPSQARLSSNAPSYMSMLDRSRRADTEDPNAENALAGAGGGGGAALSNSDRAPASGVLSSSPGGHSSFRNSPGRSGGGGGGMVKAAPSSRRGGAAWTQGVNPCNPTRLQQKHGQQYRRWNHIMSSATQHPKRYASVTNWRSLTTPACLPLTTDFFPTTEELANSYRVTTYSIAPDDEALPYERLDGSELGSLESLRAELLSQRLALGFQMIVSSAIDKTLVPGPEEPSPIVGPGQGGSKFWTGKSSTTVRAAARPYFASLGDHVHQISLDSSGKNVEVKRFLREKRGDKAGDAPMVTSAAVAAAMDSQRFAPYICRIWPRLLSGYAQCTVRFPFSSLASYNWNYHDHYILGFHDDLSDNMRFWRTRFLLVPTAARPMNDKVLNPFNGNLDEEELRLEGFKRMQETLERSRWQHPGERGSNNRLAVSSGLGVEFMTSAPSVFIRYEWPKRQASAGPDSNGDMSSSIVSTASTSSAGGTSRLLSRAATSSEIVVAMQVPGTGCPIHTRTWNFNVHRNVFTGTDFVDWALRSVDGVSVREDAVQFGVELLRRGLFEHVNKKHSFMDGHYFYRIAPALAAAATAESSAAAEAAAAAGAKAAKDPKDAGPATFEMTRMMKIDLDPDGGSFRKELAVLHYSTTCNAKDSYSFHLHWLTCSSRLVDNLVQNWAFKAQSYNLKLVEAPVAQAALFNNDDPFQGVLEIPFAVKPPTWRVEATSGEGGGDGGSANNDDVGEQLRAVEAAATAARPYEHPEWAEIELARRYEFVLDVEARRHFDGLAVADSHHDPSYGLTQLVHRSGAAFLQIAGAGRGFRWVNNRLHMRGFLGGGGPSTSAAAPSATPSTAMAAAAISSSSSSAATAVAVGEATGGATAAAAAVNSGIDAVRDRLVADCGSEEVLCRLWEEIEVRRARLSGWDAASG